MLSRCGRLVGVGNWSYCLLSSICPHCQLETNLQTGSLFVLLPYTHHDTTMGSSPNRQGRNSPTRHKVISPIKDSFQEPVRVHENGKTRLRRRIRNIVIMLSLTGLAILLLAGYLSDNALGHTHYAPQSQFVNWDDRREEVKESFMTSWNAYKKYAWGNDVFHPISNKGEIMFPKGLGWIIVDSLDTMMLMNLTEPLADARKWLHRSLTWDQDQDINTFETTIRMMGGLLSAHYLSTRLPHIASRRESVYLFKAVDHADRLLVAFESDSGIPYASVNIGKREGIVSHADSGASSTAEAATVQLEMKYLSYLTGNEIYWQKAESVMQVLDDQKAKAGLVPIFVHPIHGHFTTREVRLGSRGDSYYEYLIKQYLQTASRHDHTQRSAQVRRGAPHGNWRAPFTQDGSPRMLPPGNDCNGSKSTTLSCLARLTCLCSATEGRTLAEARRDPDWTKHHENDIDLAIELMNTCRGMYAVTDTGLAPEITWFNASEADLQPRPGDRWLRRESSALSKWKKDYTIKPLDAHNLQRPETVESLFMMYRITGNSMYREWGWKIFQSFQAHTLVPGGEGYTSLNDVRTVPPTTRDNVESFWLAETLKYFYLLFSPTDYMPLTEVVFNTEAHPFPRFLPRGSLKTGWQRLPR
ncbi:Putative glycoside hydrolase family 47, six-hairpin glycosidase-like superfamily [Colletotrichum destructivum]|uniref:alpha-1,2-Mannosidase n=1 Tax=Colletotrichum destructivum TaxID=34406 RepID=A0AAX4IHT1_9PEZI|nr:Putative glycoside hydrolase family 47, six-hairpin glycosidase-like superfamily [Colletotrichum destructivum]